MRRERNTKILTKAEIHAASKKAAKDLIKRCGGIDGAASSCRIRRTALADCASVHNHNRYLPIDVVLSLEQIVAYPVVAEWLAKVQGYLIFRLPELSSDSIWQKHLNSTVRKSSRLFKHILDALKDNEITSEEAADLLEQTDATISAIASLRAALLEKTKLHQQPTALRATG